jgi:hypothetical protein
MTTILLLLSLLQPQVDHNINDNYVVFESLVHDRFFCQSTQSLDDFTKCLEETKENADFLSSNEINGFWEGQVSTPYSVQFYTIQVGEYNWLMLKYRDDTSEGWYRLNGYQESDFIHFYQNVLKVFLNRERHRREIFNEWITGASLDKTIDQECIFKATKRKRPNYDCLEANALKSSFDLLITSGSNRGSLLESRGLKYISSVWSPRLYRGTYPLR